MAPTKDATSRYAKEIRELRESLGVSQVELARRIGWAKDRLSRVETGSRRLRIDDYEMMMKALNVRPDAILGGAPGAKMMPGKIAAAMPARAAGGGADDVIVDWTDKAKRAGCTFIVRVREDGEEVLGRVVAIGRRM